MPKSLVYLVDNLKFESGLIFYTLLAALLLPLSYTLRAGIPRTVSHSLQPMPYTVTHPYSPALAATQAASWQMAQPSATVGTVWPIRGKVTTEFGAPDYPFQSSHTGIDISSEHPAGSTAVVAFRAGVVTSVIHSSASYGNHVIIDHGDGLTSLYGHLYSTSVTVGQHVEAGQTIGTEGSTGDSTGTHLHFEIRQNNVPVNPRRYESDNPSGI